MNYTIKQFNNDFPSEAVCLDTIFQNRYGDLTTCPKCGVTDTKFYRVKQRKCYACMHCGHQLHPTAGTIFHKSDTPLKSWFFAIFLFSNSKNGVSAKELERHLGVTYKTAWRMAKQIRLLMAEDSGTLSGTVEADETYIGGRATGEGRQGPRSGGKQIVFGMTERKGKASAKVVPDTKLKTLMNLVETTVERGSELMTDDSHSLWVADKAGYRHNVIVHSKKEYVQGNVHTNTIEGFWSQLKRSIDGTYHAVSPKYLQHYVNEFAFRYNYRAVPIYPRLILEAARRV